MGRHLPFVDALRGYAIALVILCHTILSFPHMLWPAKRLASIGWYGVQLFFIASALTLLLSWHDRKNTDKHIYINFFIRRFFRIFPMYFVAFVIYFLLYPPQSSFSWAEIVTTFTFLNGWTPSLMPTTPDGWSAVPGNWSISNEFTFYFVFPILATKINSFWKSVLFFFVTFLMALFLNTFAYSFWSTFYSPDIVDQFIYYWFPNQFPVFGIGFVSYFVIIKILRVMDKPPFNLNVFQRGGTILALLGFSVFLFTAFLNLGRYPKFFGPFLPLHLVASFGFAIFAVSLSGSPKSIINNVPIMALGKVSFSVYLLHFAVIHVLVKKFPHMMHIDSSGYMVVFYGLVFTILVSIISYFISYLTYRFIEKPMVKFGNNMTLSTR